MKTIATINFKGGVGKTTATWALCQVVAQETAVNTLMFDLDAQMSLTQAIALNEDGSPFKNFTDWYDRAVGKKKTIFSMLLLDHDCLLVKERICSFFYNALRYYSSQLF